MNAWKIGFCAVSAVLLFGSCQTAAPVAADEIQLFAETSGRAGREWRLPQSGVTVATESEPMIEANAITAVRVVPLDLGPALVIDVSPSGASNLAAQAAHGGTRLVLVSHGHALGIARIVAGSASSQISMFVEMPVAELNTWTTALEARLAKTDRSWRG